jgi:hypothetical protein
VELAETVLMISTPRSGLHYLAKNIEHLSTSKAVFCEGYSCADSNRKTISGCPLQSSRSIRLSCASGRFILKNHDFELDLDLSQYKKVLVLRRRNWYELLMSWYLGGLKFGWDGLPDKKIDFETFAMEKMEYLFDFNQKYNELKGPKFKHLYFEDFHEVANEDVQLKDIYEFIFGESPKDVKKRSRNTLRKNSDVLKSPFFNRDFYEVVNLLAKQSSDVSRPEFMKNLKQLALEQKS